VKVLWSAGTLLILHNLGQDSKVRMKYEAGPAAAAITRAVCFIPLCPPYFPEFDSCFFNAAASRYLVSSLALSDCSMEAFQATVMSMVTLQRQKAHAKKDT
jgi:hypothetical protein